MEWDEYGNPIPPRQQQRPFDISPEWDENGNRIYGQGQPAPGRAGPPPGYNDFYGGAETFLSGVTLGANDELTGATNGAVAAAGAALSGEDPRQAYLERYRGYADQSRQFQDEFARRHPLGSALTRGTGAVAPVAATLGRGAPATLETQAAARGGLGGLTRRSAEAASVGSLYGYGAGFAGSDGNLDERTLSANEGAGIGAALGAVIPPALATANQANQRLGVPAWQALTGAARRLPTADPNALGAMGGNVRLPPPQTPSPPRPQGFDPVVGGALERLANRSRQSPRQLQSRFGEYRMNPQGQVLADAFDQPGVQTMRSMTQSPGQTGQRAAEVARQRFTEAPERILTELNRRMAVAETPEQAMASLRGQYERVSAENYRPVFERRMTPEQRLNLDRRTAPFHDDPVFRDAVQRAERVFSRDQRLGLVEGRIDDNYARYMHYVKMGLDDAVASAPIGSRGLQSTEMRGVYAMRQRILSAIDDNVPGYREARAQWGGLIEAEEALTQGAQMVNVGSGTVRQQMNAMSPFARYHARVGFANAVANRTGLRGSVNGNRNVAEVLGSPEMQRRVRAMFESPDEAAAFLDTLNQQNMLMRNAQQWNGGSSTAANAAHMDDNASNALEAGIDLASGRRTSAVSRLRNMATGGAQERANNRVGEALLRRVDTDEGFARAVVAELERREAARAAQAQVSRVGGAINGQNQRRRE